MDLSVWISTTKHWICDSVTSWRDEKLWVNTVSAMLWYNEVVIICTLQKSPTGMPPSTTTLLLTYKVFWLISLSRNLCQASCAKFNLCIDTRLCKPGAHWTLLSLARRNVCPLPSPSSPLTQLLPPTILRKHRCSLSLLPPPNTQCPTCPAWTTWWPHFHMKIKSLSWPHKHSREKRCILSYPIYQDTISADSQLCAFWVLDSLVGLFCLHNVIKLSDLQGTYLSMRNTLRCGVTLLM